MFTSSQLNHGVASLRFDEGAFLYGLVRGLGPARIVEIGRFKGGSTFITAAAMAPGSALDSYDLHVALRDDLQGPDLDRELTSALERYGLGTASAWLWPTRGRCRSRTPGSASCSWTATIRTRARPPTCSAGRRWSDQAATS